MAKLNNLDLSGSLGGGAISAILNLIYPIGSYFISSSEEFNTLEKVQNHFGGNWEQVVDRFLVGAGNLYTVGATGGSKDAIVVSHEHTTNTVSAHTHGPGSLSGYYKMRDSDKGDGVWGAEAYYYSAHDTNSAAGAVVINSGATGSAGSHSHTVNSTGSSGTNANLPPYLAVYIWKRIG